MCVKVSAKMRVPVNHPFIDWIFHDKPSSYWGILHDCGNPHITDWIPHKWMIYEKSEKKNMTGGTPHDFGNFRKPPYMNEKMALNFRKPPKNPTAACRHLRGSSPKRSSPCRAISERKESKVKQPWII
jgi:hypothetical protein